MSSKNKIPVSLTIAFIGIIIGLTGEMMPDNVKNGIKAFLTENTGLSYSSIWISALSFFVLILFFFIWRDLKSPDASVIDSSVPEDAAAKTIVNQYGEKSVNIGKNEGDINIS